LISHGCLNDLIKLIVVEQSLILVFCQFNVRNQPSIEFKYIIDH
jgi:hypothetical protein